MPIILRTLPQKGEKPGSGPMLQDTVAGKVYTHRRPHLTEMNGFVEGFLNKQVVGVSGAEGGGSRYRPAQLLILAGSEECEHLKEGVSDRDLAEAWEDFIKTLTKEDKHAEEKLTTEQWKEFVLKWVKENSGRKGRVENTPPQGGQGGNNQRQANA